MELSGDEKKIQALFRELRFNDEHVAPQFNLLLNRVTIASIRPSRVFNLSLAFATLVILAIGAVLWRSNTRLQKPTTRPALATVPNSDFLPFASERSDQSIATVRPRNSPDRKLSNINRRHLLAKRLAARREAEVLAANDQALETAAAMAKWASPTATLLSSSTGEVLSGLPQLNQNASQLKSFLPSSSN